VEIAPPWLLCYSPEHHAVVLHTPVKDVREAFGCALDLATGAWHCPGQPGEELRAWGAWHAWENGRVAERILCVDTKGAAVSPLGVGCFWTDASDLAPPVCRFDPQTGTVDLRGVTPPWAPFVPLADGRPVLRGATIHEAQQRGPTLALLCSHPDWPSFMLRLFRGPEGGALEEIPLTQWAHQFILSNDGTRLARKLPRDRLEIRAVGSAATSVTRRGGYSGGPVLFLSDYALVLQTGNRRFHWLRWHRDALGVSHPHQGDPALRQATTVSDKVTWARHGDVPAFLKYDPHRFGPAASRLVLALTDRYGQVAIFDCDQCLVCMLFAIRGTLAGWMPDGTRFGPASLTGGPPTAGAMDKFGRALLDACNKWGPS
jgi:hypothetical protein